MSQARNTEKLKDELRLLKSACVEEKLVRALRAGKSGKAREPSQLLLWLPKDFKEVK